MKRLRFFTNASLSHDHFPLGLVWLHFHCWRWCFPNHRTTRHCFCHFKLHTNYQKRSSLFIIENHLNIFFNTKFKKPEITFLFFAAGNFYFRMKMFKYHFSFTLVLEHNNQRTQNHFFTCVCFCSTKVHYDFFFYFIFCLGFLFPPPPPFLLSSFGLSLATFFFFLFSTTGCEWHLSLLVFPNVSKSTETKIYYF